MEFWKHRRQRVEGEAVVAAARQPAGPPDHRGAFAEGLRQGRREERSRHRGHPVLLLLVALVAVVGAAVLALAVREGSFSRGGQVVDQQLSVAADNAQVAGQKAAAETGQAIRDAGATIEQKTSNANGQKK